MRSNFMRDGQFTIKMFILFFLPFQCLTHIFCTNIQQDTFYLFTLYSCNL